MEKCTKLNTFKYSLRNSPPYQANKCKNMTKKGNDGKLYLSKPDNKGVYKWVGVNKTKKTPTKQDLQMLVKKYGVTKSGSNKQVAQRIMKIRSHLIKNKTDIKILSHFM